MKNNNHWAVFVSNQANKHLFTTQVLEGKATETLSPFNQLKGALFSNISLNELIAEEERHEQLTAAKRSQPEPEIFVKWGTKKALLNYLLSSNPDFIILDNPFDNLDISSQKSLLSRLEEISNKVSVIQLVSRKKDLISFIENTISIEGDDTVVFHKDMKKFLSSLNSEQYIIKSAVPPPLHEYPIDTKELVRFNKVWVSYNEKAIVKDIEWTIKAGEFWQLVGPNGSGKTTLLSMITGDNPKGYGQDLYLFGRKKGSGETVWDIKKKVGYFTPAIAEQFSRYHTLGQMIISGFFDSIGLYTKPSDLQIKLSNDWLELIEMSHLKETSFCLLTLGQQRMALIARAMVKHPPLMILDEPIAGLDDHNAKVVISLINKIAAESTTAILYVSHRQEEDLKPQFIFELTPSPLGSIGKTLNYSV